MLPVAYSARAAAADSLLRVTPGTRFLLHAKGEALLRLGRFDPAKTALQSFTWTGADERLEAMREKALGQAELRLRQYQEARVSFWLSLNSVSTPAARHDVDDWIGFCDWMATHED